MSGPIRPEEAAGKKQIPETVFEVVNELIAKHLRGATAVVKQVDVVNALVARGFDRNAVFENHYLDVESAYEAVGWRVSYSKPAYNELGESTFTFKRVAPTAGAKANTKKEKQS